MEKSHLTLVHSKPETKDQYKQQLGDLYHYIATFKLLSEALPKSRERDIILRTAQEQASAIRDLARKSGYIE